MKLSEALSVILEVEELQIQLVHKHFPGAVSFVDEMLLPQKVRRLIDRICLNPKYHTLI